MRLILGSASPRRLDLLAQIGVEPDAVQPADIDETPLPKERPLIYCRRMAEGKAQAIMLEGDDIALTADTTVALGRRILGKPADEKEAESFLRLMSGRRHSVITAVVVRSAERLWRRDVVTKVLMKRLSERELAEYLATGEWRGKAGAYGIQGRAAAFLPWISGSFSAVAGLPLAETSKLLARAGYRPGAGSP